MNKTERGKKSPVPIKKIIGAIINLLIYALCVFFEKRFFYDFINWILWGTLVIIAVMFIVAILKKMPRLYKISVLCVYFGALIILTFILISATGVLASILNAKNGEELYETLKTQYGTNLYVVLIVIQFLQVTFIPIASSIVTAAGYYLCGQNVWLTILFCCIGLWGGSLFAFALGRIFGVKLVKWVAGEKVLHKYNQFVKGKDKVMLGYMFIFPVYPDDVLCLIAGLTTMSWREFILLQFVSRPLNVACTVFLLYFGTSLTALFPLDSVIGILFWIVMAVLLVASFIIVWKKADKLEAAMTKLISKISGRPVISDINTIYKLTSEADKRDEESKRKAREAEENKASAPAADKTDEVVAAVIAEKEPVIPAPKTPIIEKPKETAEQKEARELSEANEIVDKILESNETIEF
jgi:uncharacterized membrane protein YdjX (TVP38/TMEM64 family)